MNSGTKGQIGRVGGGLLLGSRQGEAPGPEEGRGSSPESGGISAMEVVIGEVARRRGVVDVG